MVAKTVYFLYILRTLSTEKHWLDDYDVADANEDFWKPVLSLENDATNENVVGYEKLTTNDDSQINGSLTIQCDEVPYPDTNKVYIYKPIIFRFIFKTFPQAAEKSLLIETKPIDKQEKTEGYKTFPSQSDFVEVYEITYLIAKLLIYILTDYLSHSSGNHTANNDSTCK